MKRIVKMIQANTQTTKDALRSLFAITHVAIPVGIRRVMCSLCVVTEILVSLCLVTTLL
jgi:hypothetical protein